MKANEKFNETVNDKNAGVPSGMLNDLMSGVMHDRMKPSEIRNLNNFGYYIQGARCVMLRVMEEWLPQLRREDAVYMKAIMKLALADVRNTERYLMRDPIGFRNHQSDKRGRLYSAEAFFIEKDKQ